jgi:hypothetical protein
MVIQAIFSLMSTYTQKFWIRQNQQWLGRCIGACDLLAERWGVDELSAFKKNVGRTG